jgi:hypothetical protein
MFVTSYGLVVLLGIAAHVIVSIALARAAERKGRNFTAFFFISFFLSWAVALIIIASLPGAASATSPNGRIERNCPFCDERISARAVICKHCGRDIQIQQPSELVASPVDTAKDSSEESTGEGSDISGVVVSLLSVVVGGIVASFGITHGSYDILGNFHDGPLAIALPVVVLLGALVPVTTITVVVVRALK